MHKHLTWTDRLRIEKALKEGMGVYKIAERLHVHNTTIYKELQRGSYTRLNYDLTTRICYSPDIAEAKYRENLKAKGAGLKIGKDRKLAEYIESLIVDKGYSPAAAAAELKRCGEKFSVHVSEKTIYNYIDKGIFLRLTRANLPLKGEQKRKYNRVKKAARPPKGESIEQRPEEIAQRNTFGHWEMDCVVGKKRTKTALLVLSERFTRQEIIIKMPDKTANSVVKSLDALERKMKGDFSKIFQTITVDNGAEFANCDGMEKSVYSDAKRTKIYYCHPYSAYERGTNENINKMIRRFIPKGTDLRKVTSKYIKSIEEWINNYPREILGFSSSNDLYKIATQNL